MQPENNGRLSENAKPRITESPYIAYFSIIFMLYVVFPASGGEHNI